MHHFERRKTKREGHEFCTRRRDLLTGTSEAFDIVLTHCALRMGNWNDDED